MPVVNCLKDELLKQLDLKSEDPDKDLDQLCFDFGMEVEVWDPRKELKESEQQKLSDSELQVLYKVEVCANRPDLLCTEGIVRALQMYTGKLPPVEYYPVSGNLEFVIQKSVLDVRPFCVVGVLRNISFSEASYKSFIDLQDKLHQTIGKKRSLVSIGTHDLDTLNGPFSYEARLPQDISFVPLKSTTEMNGQQLMEHLEKDPYLGPYLPLIRHKPRYPVICDSKGVVLSLPPIINGRHSRITNSTHNVLIEVTALDSTKANIVLGVVTAMFSEYCQPQWQIEQVKVITPDGNQTLSPCLAPRLQPVSLNRINSSLGLSLKADEVASLVRRMGIPATVSDRCDDTINCMVPTTRSDVLHECDILEDVAIAFGYNNLVPTPLHTCTVGHQLPLTKLADLVGQEVANAGYTEVMNFALCSRADNYESLKRVEDGLCIAVGNPKAAEFQIGRTTLLSGMLKCLIFNKTATLPIRIFEIGDVILQDQQYPVGACNLKKLGAVYCSKTSGFEFIHGLLDQIMLCLNVPWKDDPWKNDLTPTSDVLSYYLRPSEDPTFMKNRRADIYIRDKQIGVIGIIHPDVLKNFALDNPCSALEISLECPNGL